MGLFGRLFGTDSVPTIPFDTYDAAQRVLPEPYEPYVGAFSVPVVDPGYPLVEAYRSHVEAMWRSQPNVRKVVDFIARNVASIPLHAFERVSDTDRQRLHGHPLSEVMRTPQPRVAAYRFWHSVISDGLLYDRWALVKQDRVDGAGVELVQVPSWRLRLDVDALRRVSSAWYWVGDGRAVDGDRDGWRPLDLALLVYDYGYAPKSAGVSPLETLADVLAESAEAVTYRRQVWKNGARVPAWIERPAGAEWGAAGRERFAAGFRAAYTGTGPQAGGVPLLEDGMKLHEFKAYSPQDSQDLEGRRLSAIEVAAAYHIAPELVGAQQGNYSNVREFRQMLYRDSLGPYISAWEGALNAQLVPDLSAGRRLYVEANVESKLRGSFEEQAGIMQSATGAPWLTRNEARALQNRAPLAGGDDLVVPLNVLVGGQASPRDSAPKRRGVQVKARPDETLVEKATEVIAAFFDRQGRALATLAGTGGLSWDADRWNGELADDLYRLNALIATDAGRKALERLGVDPQSWDEAMTLAWLRANAAGVAEGINGRTRTEVEATADDEDRSAAVRNLFAGVVAARAAQAAVTQVSAVSGFGATEAVKQAGVTATKTWRVRSPNPRPSHARMNGQTVPVGETFSNGARWPGDSTLDDDERAGCTCDIDVTVEA